LKKISKKIDSWLEDTTNSIGSEQSYRSMINKYFEFLKVDDPDNYLNDLEYMDNNKKREMTEKYKDDVRTFKRFLVGKNGTNMTVSPKTFSLNMTAIKSCFEANGVFINQKWWNKINKLSVRIAPITKNVIPFKADLYNIINNANSRAKALFLTLASSGMRIQECLSVTVDHVFLNERPPRIHLEAEWTKTGIARDVYISNEAKRWITNWMKHRDNYINSVNNRLENHPSISRERNYATLFAFRPTTCHEMWENLLYKADGIKKERDRKKRKLQKKGKYTEIDPKTNRYIYHIHSLRKFFSRRSTMDRDAIEQLLGHTTKDYNMAYTEYQPQELKQIYLENIESVTILTNSDMQSQEKVKELENKIRVLEQKEDYYKTIEERIEPLEKYLKEMEKYYKEHPEKVDFP
jgi:integrase